MTDLVMRRSSPHVLLSHMALYGLGAILDTQGLDVRVGWTNGGDPRPAVVVSQSDGAAVAAAVLRHASAAWEEGSWVRRDHMLKGKTAVDETARGLMSPRLTPFEDEATWRAVQRARHVVLDDLTDRAAWLDLRFLAALGEPSYWSRNRKGDMLQDAGASRLEMQPRNTGSEFVGTRLRKLAEAVAARTPDEIMSGLRGDIVRDEAGGDKLDSHTATGFAGLGPTDNALAWCALWGIAELPIAMRVATGRSFANRPAKTTGHLGRGRREWFYALMWTDGWRPARLRTVLAGGAARTVAAVDVDVLDGQATTAKLTAAKAWLAARGVQGLMRFPIQRFGSDSAPERRAMRGEPITLGAG